MKKLCGALSLLLCLTLIFSSIAVFADNVDDKILTLEEAKELALKNDVQYNLQESYIQDALEKYEELSEDSSKTITRTSDASDKAAAAISQDIALENADTSYRKAVLNKTDLKRSSDYEVTNDFYAVIEAQNSLMNAETEMNLKKKDLDTARIKYELKIITQSSFSQAETTYASSEATYNKAALELQNSIAQLGKSIGEDLDISKYQLNTTFIIPDIKSIDVKKIIEDNLKNNLSYFSAKEQYRLAEYELALTEEKYYNYFEDHKSMPASVEEKFDNMLYDAQKNFDNVEYSYNEKLYDLAVTINKQYNSLVDLYESYEDDKEEFEDTKVAYEENKIKYQMGIITKKALDSSAASLSKLENQLYSTKISINEQYVALTQYSLDE